MSLTPEQVAAEQAAAAAAAAKTPNLKYAKADKPARYVSKETHTATFDIQVRGDTVFGQRSEGNKIEWHVPKKHVEAFEAHWHFTVGNIVRADE